MDNLQDLAADIAQMATNGVQNFERGMQQCALMVEAAMKVEAGAGGAHPYGQGRGGVGGPPAVVTGDLRRSVTHQQVGPEWRVGPADIPHSVHPTKKPSRAKSHATCGEIGMYLEGGMEGGGPPYPFVQPALDAVGGQMEATIAAEFVGPLDA